MSFIRETLVGIRVTLVLWVMTALIYPFFLIAFGQIFFPYQANGSLIETDRGAVVGSSLIGQSFSSDRYFWSRPSVVNYSEGLEAQPTGVSGASNLAPSNPELLTRIEANSVRLKAAGVQPTGDLVYTSGSGLDPHISPEAAIAQIKRVAAARSLATNQVERLVSKHTESRFLGIFGEPGINVVRLNLALDNLEPKT